jgi:hypothetical protein
MYPVALLSIQKPPGCPGLVLPACRVDNEGFSHEGFLVAHFVKAFKGRAIRAKI